MVFKCSQILISFIFKFYWSDTSSFLLGSFVLETSKADCNSSVGAGVGSNSIPANFSLHILRLFRFIAF